MVLAGWTSGERSLGLTGIGRLSICSGQRFGSNDDGVRKMARQYCGPMYAPAERKM